MRRMVACVSLAIASSTVLRAQDLPNIVAGLDRGTVRLSYTTRPGTCGTRNNIELPTQHTHRGRWQDEPCIEGPAFLQLAVRDGRVVGADARVGQETWPEAAGPVTSLGRMAAPTASRSLLAMVEEAEADAGEDLVFAAILADSVALVEPLLRVARQAAAPEGARRAAVFWLSHGTDENVTAELEGLAMDATLAMEVREAAVFGLSQAAGEDGAQALMRVAQSPAPADLREHAVFWLGQRQDAASFDFLRTVYRESPDPGIRDKVIFAMSQLDSPEATRWLLSIAQDASQPTDARKNALFWAGQSEAAGDELLALYDRLTERDIKRQLIFVFAQQDREASLGKLMEIARTEPDQDLRENAIFWLGQSDQPEAIAFLEDLITN